MKIGTVQASAPVRADLAGGTLDIWPLGCLVEKGATVAVALTLRTEAWVGAPTTPGRLTTRSLDLGRTRRSDVCTGRASRGPLELLERIARRLAPSVALDLTSRSPVRAGSGLGTSSALGIAAAAALARAAGLRLARARLVALVRDVEAQILGIPTGTQDHEAALRGGLVVMRHASGGGEIVRAGAATLRALDERLIVVDSGVARSSGPSNWDMFRRAIERDDEALRALRAVARAGRGAAESLENGAWKMLGSAMRADLEARRAWSSHVVTPELERLFDAARRGGALGWKVCGAGGGGYAIVLAEPDRRARVEASIEEAGFSIARDARPAPAGLRVFVGSKAP